MLFKAKQIPVLFVHSLVLPTSQWFPKFVLSFFYMRESNQGRNVVFFCVLWRSWGTWHARQSICFQIRITLNCQEHLFMYVWVTICMYSVDMVVGTPNFPEPHLCFEVSAAQSLFLFRAVRLCCSAGQVALVLLGGYKLLCWLKVFFFLQELKKKQSLQSCNSAKLEHFLHP